MRSESHLFHSVLPYAALFCVALLPAQEPPFHESVSVEIAEPLTNAFSVVAGDVTGDGRPDILIGAVGAVVQLRMGDDSRLSPGILIPTGCPLQRLALADLDRDGQLDLVTWCPSSGLVIAYRGDGQGKFSEVSRVALKATSARGMTARDLDLDGVLDLAVCQSGGVAVVAGNGDLTFRVVNPLLEIRTMGGQATPMSIVSADFNADGIPDLATANTVYDDQGSVFLGTGGGKFSPETKVSSNGRPMDLVAGDFNRDGRLDLAFACQGALVVRSGRGDGTFDVGPEVSIAASPMSVATADLNADGSTDLVLGDYYGGEISILLNKGDGTFQNAKAVWSIGDVFALVLTDLNGDSVPDLVAASYSGSSALYALGAGNGEFETPSYFGSYPANAFSFLAADLDADGTGDLAVVAERRRTITFLRKGFSAVEWTWWKEYPITARFGDFDGDGVSDLVVATLHVWIDEPGKDRGASLQFLKGRGDGTFELKTQTTVERCPVFQGVSYSTVGGMLSLTPGDFDGNGTLDLAVGNDPLREIQIYLGIGDGSFRLHHSVSTGSRLISSGDFDGDGVHELVLGTASYSPGSPSLVTFFTWAPEDNLRESSKYEVCAETTPTFSTMLSLRAGDFDGDRSLDLVVNCGTSINVLRNRGNGQFQTSSAIQTDGGRTFAAPIAVADFDRDGKDDIVAILPVRGPVPSAELLALLSEGELKFRAPISQPAPAQIAAITALDFDGDRRPDLAMVDASNGKLKVLRNNFPP